MIPASMGLRFQIPADLDTFTVIASWGTYHSVPDERPDAPRSRRYQRIPVEIRTTVTVADLVPGVTTPYPLHDKVVLRVDRYDDTERGCRMIEVALRNDRVTPRKIPVDAWLYQTWLIVDAGGADAFLPVTDALIDIRDECDDELRRLRLQYRDRLEFASAAPARSTGPPPPTRGGPPRCGPHGFRPARPRRPLRRRSRRHCWTWKRSPQPTATSWKPG